MNVYSTQGLGIVQVINSRIVTSDCELCDGGMGVGLGWGRG